MANAQLDPQAARLLTGIGIEVERAILRRLLERMSKPVDESGRGTIHSEEIRAAFVELLHSDHSELIAAVNRRDANIPADRDDARRAG